MKFWKLHALGNNFIFVLNEAWANYPELAIALCNPRTSVGGDGLLGIDMAGPEPLVRMWNPDGSEDFCGNGLCCSAHLLDHLGHGLITRLRTPNRDVGITFESLDASNAKVAVTIPRGTFNWRDVPLDLAHGRTDGTFAEFQVEGSWVQTVSLNNGNMHSILLVKALPDDATFQRLGPLIETHPIFPNRTNVVWCVPENGRLRLRIWERGVGETLACGTGAAAAAEVCERVGLTEMRTMIVEMPGGNAEVSLNSDHVSMQTITTIAFEGALIDRIYGTIYPEPSFDC
jgi:diaminopimelate epimerase